MTAKKRLIIIDSNSLIHRAYHALPPLTTKRGELVSAIYGFLLVFFKAIREFQPDFIVACFDFPAPTFRHKKFKEYKAKRPPAPEELYRQIPKVKEILESFNVPIFEKEGFEADDLIGTIAQSAPKKQILPEIETIILSGDLDTLQLVSPQTKIYTLRKGVKDIILYDQSLVKEKYQGLRPSQLLDFKALKGDPSDNVPGVTGIGEKTAIKLIKEFGSLENLYQNLEKKLDKAKKLKPKLRETLSRYKDQAFFSKMLIQIKKDVPIKFNLKKCQWTPPTHYPKRMEKIVRLLKGLEFYSLIERLPKLKEQSGKSSIIRENLKLWQNKKRGN